MVMGLVSSLREHVAVAVVEVAGPDGTRSDTRLPELVASVWLPTDDSGADGNRRGGGAKAEAWAATSWAAPRSGGGDPCGQYRIRPTVASAGSPAGLIQLPPHDRHTACAGPVESGGGRADDRQVSLRAANLAVCAAWAMCLAPTPVHAQALPALAPDAVIRIASAGDSAQHPVILLLHGKNGFQAGRDVYNRYADRFASHGYDVYAVQYYDGNDELIMNSPDRSVRQDLFQRRLRTWIATVRAGIGYVANLPTTDARRIGLIGYSNGALIAIGTAGLDRRVGAVVELYGAIPSALSGSITRLPPTLILHGDADQVTPVERAYALERFLRERSVAYAIHIYPGADHGFDADPENPDARDAERRAAAFFDAQLKR